MHLQVCRPWIYILVSRCLWCVNFWIWERVLHIVGCACDLSHVSSIWHLNQVWIGFGFFVSRNHTNLDPNPPLHGLCPQQNLGIIGSFLCSKMASGHPYHHCWSGTRSSQFFFFFSIQSLVVLSSRTNIMPAWVNTT